MVKIERRLLIDATLFGVLLTFFVAAADAFGLLGPLENWFYDQRALHCQRWMPAPTTKLVHLDIDGPSLDAIGAWPWDRADVADLLDELGRAGPRAVALDVLFSEPQRVTGSAAGKAGNPDAKLAAAVKKLGNCVVAASFPFRRDAVGPVYGAVRSELMADAELTEGDVVVALTRKGRTEPDLAALVHEVFYTARRDALFQRVVAEAEGAGEDAIRKKLLPRTDPVLETSASNALRVVLTEVRAAKALRRLSIEPAGERPPLVQNLLEDAPLAPLSEAAAAGGFVDYPQSADGKVRAVPLFLAHDGAVYPQLGLALAWKLLGAEVGHVRLGENEVLLPRGELPDLPVPVRTVAAGDLLGVGRDAPLSANVSWFGGRDWSTMYDHPARRVPRQHLPMTALWDACQVRRRIVGNNADAFRTMMNIVPESLEDEYAQELSADDVEGHARRIERLLPLVDVPPEEDPKRAEVLAWVQKLRAVREENPKLLAELTAYRARLREMLDGKAVLVGWTATGVIADFLPTSLHPRCPGVVLHGVVFNQVMTGEVWRTTPQWVTLLATLGVGVLATLAVSFLSPARAALSVAALLAAYLALNGYFLFDYGNLIVGAAGPAVAVGFVFSGGTLAKLALERWERARITRRFSSYVDPKIVDYVIKHPDQAHFEGQIREMTVVFCDVAGFTTLTETHGSDTVPMLNELWGVMVPVIRSNGGIVNKFLGDGIMFFFGAPEQSPRHASDAVSAVLAMREALDGFNRTIAATRKWPALALRYGVSTGTMVVGDAGSADTGAGSGAADYTVLGDNVNLGSRLEGANKAVGTTALVTARTVELSQDAGLLFRPIGKLCVVGKREGVMTYEPIARLADATEEQKQLAVNTQAMVDAFLAGRLSECVEAIERMDAARGPGKLTALYRDRCEWYLRDPSPEPFDCQITLTEK